MQTELASSLNSALDCEFDMLRRPLRSDETEKLYGKYRHPLPNQLLRILNSREVNEEIERQLIYFLIYKKLESYLLNSNSGVRDLERQIEESVDSLNRIIR